MNADAIEMLWEAHNEVAARAAIPRLWRLRHHARDGRYARAELRAWVRILRAVKP